VQPGLAVVCAGNEIPRRLRRDGVYFPRHYFVSLGKSSRRAWGHFRVGSAGMVNQIGVDAAEMSCEKRQHEVTDDPPHAFPAQCR
jgi:hypothetical protein